MKNSFKFIILVAFVCTGIQGETEEESNVVYDANGELTVEGYSHEEVMDYTDDLWERTEHGNISPNDAKSEFKDFSGVTIFEFLTEANEITLAEGSGLLDEDTADEVETELEEGSEANSAIQTDSNQNNDKIIEERTEKQNQAETSTLFVQNGFMSF